MDSSGVGFVEWKLVEGILEVVLQHLRLKSAFWGNLVTPRGTSVSHEVAHNSGGAAGGKTTYEHGLLSHFLRGANKLNSQLEPMKSQQRTHCDMTLSFLKLGTEN